MRYIRWTSYFITIAGVAMVAAGVLFDLNATITLIGMMLVVAGVIKVVAVGLWHGVGGFGAPLTSEDHVIPVRPKRNR
jgi:hypothetical protein